jgi:hypothetical protein
MLLRVKIKQTQLILQIEFAQVKSNIVPAR